MGAYERKIIHSKIEGNKYVTTYSIGEEPNRRIIIEKIIRKPIDPKVENIIQIIIFVCSFNYVFNIWIWICFLYF